MDIAVGLLPEIGIGDDHPLAEETGGRLIGPDHAGVAHQLVVEPEVHEVQNRVLDASDVLVDRQPVVGPLVELAFGVRAAIAGVIPG